MHAVCIKYDSSLCPCCGALCYVLCGHNTLNPHTFPSALLNRVLFRMRVSAASHTCEQVRSCSLCGTQQRGSRAWVTCAAWLCLTLTGTATQSTALPRTPTSTCAASRLVVWWLVCLFVFGGCFWCRFFVRALLVCCCVFICAGTTQRFYSRQCMQVVDRPLTPQPTASQPTQKVTQKTTQSTNRARWRRAF